MEPDNIMDSAHRRANSIPEDHQRRFSGENSPRKIKKRYVLITYIVTAPQ
jgi:hypothetical protein